MGNQLTGYMLTRTLIELEITSWGNNIGSNLFFSTGLMMEQVNPNTLLANFDLNLTIARILSFLFLGFGTVSFAIVASLLYIMRLNPKKIMM